MTGERKPTSTLDGVDYEFSPELDIGTLANDQLVCADAAVSIREAAIVMDAEGVGLLLLEDNDGLQGVVSERDLVRAIASDADLDAPASTVGNGHSIYQTLATASIGDVATEMMEGYVRHVLIVDVDGKATGIVSVRDLLAVIAN